MVDIKLESGMVFRLPSHPKFPPFKIYNVRWEKVKLLEMEQQFLNLHQHETFEDKDNVMAARDALDLINKEYWVQVKE